MSGTTAARVYFLAAFSSAMTALFWLWRSAQSPLHDFAFSQVPFTNFLMQLNRPAIFFSVVTSGEGQPDEVVLHLAVFVQWALVGLIVSRLIVRRT